MSLMSLAEADVESIERATLAAVAPQRVETLPGWLLPMDGGTVGRARSAVPLSHGAALAADVEALDAIAETYRTHGFVPRFRLPDTPAWATAHAHLTARGFERVQPTLTQTAPLAALAALASHPSVELAAQPDAAWMAMFLGEGMDSVDGASRSQALARAQGTLFASLREGGRTLACGAASYGFGWLSVHGMRTALDQRGRGLASAVMRAMADEAARRGITRVFLQVDAANTPALSLYRRIGFETAWPYVYFHPAGTSGSA